MRRVAALALGVVGYGTLATLAPVIAALPALAAFIAAGRLLTR